MNRFRSCRRTSGLVVLGPTLFALACGSVEHESMAIPLVDRFEEATIQGAVEVEADLPRIEWSFGEGTSKDDLQVLSGLTDVRVVEDQLTGRTTEGALLALAGSDRLDSDDYFHAIEIRLQVSAGSRLGVSFDSSEEIDVEETVEDFSDAQFMDFNIDLKPGDELETYTLTASHALFQGSFPLGRARHILIRPTDANNATFRIDSVRLVSVREHLASIPSGVGWQGLGEVYRETLVARSPEKIAYEVDLPSEPYLDIAFGTVDPSPVTFRVDIAVDDVETTILRKTVSTPQRWQPEKLDLGDWAGRQVALSLSVEADRAGIPAYWGSPVIRNRAGRPSTVDGSAAREAVVGAETPPPQAVILIVADTLRRDHLDAYGYERPTAPTVRRLAENGVLFRDNISQGTWTKVSVPSILTSLYPTTHGIKDMADKMPASVTTLAEAFRAAGYATLATSSVPFSGKLTNLHQGVEVLHESSSMPDSDHSESKTARTYTDRLLEWIDLHQDVPFFALLHVFDPHSPFEPYAPYKSLWMDPDDLASHQEDMKTVKKFIEDGFFKRQALPTREEIEKSGVDVETYVAREKAWYDASIRAMDLEIARLLEHLQHLGLDDDTLIVFMSDHGEEFLEHGRHFHGYHAYGEMLNVPLIFWWPSGLPGGLEIDTTVESIDVMPTILELSRLPVPSEVQGQSLLPLMARDAPTSLGWEPRPAVAEHAWAPAASEGVKGAELDSLVVVDGQWKLIWNTRIPDERPEYELYEHRQDPINLHNVAAEHPAIVEKMAAYLKRWREAKLAAKLDADEATEAMSPQELEKLKALGYID